MGSMYTYTRAHIWVTSVDNFSGRDLKRENQDMHYYRKRAHE